MLKCHCRVWRAEEKEEVHFSIDTHMLTVKLSPSVRASRPIAHGSMIIQPEALKWCSPKSIICSCTNYGLYYCLIFDKR